MSLGCSSCLGSSSVNLGTYSTYHCSCLRSNLHLNHNLDYCSRRCWLDYCRCRRCCRRCCRCCHRCRRCHRCHRCCRRFCRRFGRSRCLGRSSPLHDHLLSRMHLFRFSADLMMVYILFSYHLEHGEWFQIHPF